MLKECYESEVQGLYKLIKESSPNMGRSSLNQRASESYSGGVRECGVGRAFQTETES